MNRFLRSVLLVVGLLCASGQAPAAARDALVTKTLRTGNGRVMKLALPRGFTYSIVAEGFKRPRFFARSPDNRIFLTSLYNLADNTRGAIYILDGFDPATGRIKRVIPWKTGLRNPNSVAFMKDAAGKQWIYVALTDVLMRYPYVDGETSPSGAAQMVARFPDRGMSAANGGWHLTRTVAAGPNGKVYVSVGSSCNACIETPAEQDRRAVVLEMNPDGSDSRVFARGVRNAVWMQFSGNQLMASNQGADHLGANAPNDTFYALRRGTDYGWPHCYVSGTQIKADARFPRAAGCKGVGTPLGRFDAHASALGFDLFPAANNRLLANEYLVALHGSGSTRLGRGYKIVRMSSVGNPLGDFMTGFLTRGVVSGRPCGILRVAPDTFLFTDDKFGIVYLVRPEVASPAH